MQVTQGLTSIGETSTSKLILREDKCQHFCNSLKDSEARPFRIRLLRDQRSSWRLQTTMSLLGLPHSPITLSAGVTSIPIVLLLMPAQTTLRLTSGLATTVSSRRLSLRNPVQP